MDIKEKNKNWSLEAAGGDEQLTIIYNPSIRLKELSHCAVVHWDFEKHE
jgi:hypothetical protein